MRIHEVTTHGSTHNERNYELPPNFTKADIQTMLATCVYPYTNTVDRHLERIVAELKANGSSEHAWTRWSVAR